MMENVRAEKDVKIKNVWTNAHILIVEVKFVIKVFVKNANKIVIVKLGLFVKMKSASTNAH